MRTRELDPLSPAVLQALGWCYYQARRFDESLATFRAMLEAIPDFAYGLVTFSWLLRHTGAMDEAVRSAEKALTLSSGSPFYLCAVGAAYAAAGKETQARNVLDQLEQTAPHSYISPYHRAMIHLQLGDRERRWNFWSRRTRSKMPGSSGLVSNRRWDRLRGEPAFDQILRDLRHPAIDRKPARTAALKALTKENVRKHIAPITTQIAIPTPETTTGENEEARQLYTAGRYYSTRRTAEGLRQAIERLNARSRSIRTSRSRTPSSRIATRCSTGTSNHRRPKHGRARRKSALAAVEADPDLAEAHASLGFVRLHYDRDWIAAERELRRAIQLKSPEIRWPIAGTPTVCRPWAVTTKLTPRSSTGATDLAAVGGDRDGGGERSVSGRQV